MPPKRKLQRDDDEDYVSYRDDDEDYIDMKIGRGSGGSKKSNNMTTMRTSSTSTLVNSSLSATTMIDDPDGYGFFQDLSSSLTLKKDHDKRPIWITKNNIIILEAFSKYYTQAYDFLIDISEPMSRPTYFHTYKLTEDSLYAAVAVSRTTDSIIKYLGILCKTEIPSEVIHFIRSCTATFGKAKLVLKNNVYFVESQFPDVLRELLKNPVIRNARILESDILSTSLPTASGSHTSTSTNTAAMSVSNSGAMSATTSTAIVTADGFLESSAPKEYRSNRDMQLLDEDLDDEDEGEVDTDTLVNGIVQHQSVKTVSFMIDQHQVHLVKRSAKEDSKYPLLEEYDFRGDVRNPTLAMDLRPSTFIRPYQEKSLSKMFGNGRARSGIIVLPCGAGKTLTGVTAASTIKKSTIVLCINNASVKQWREQFSLWTSIQADRSIKLFTSKDNEPLPDPREACILITTYSMICYGGHRAERAELMMKSVVDKRREWGLMLLDEVHVAPAEMFQKVLTIVNAHCKLGLTATLVREDNKIKDLSFLVGPKLYEANWIDLTNQNYLARAQCVEVWCPMTKEFYREYLEHDVTSHTRIQKLLYLLNPRKFRVCEYLWKFHAARGDKIIIFSDDIAALILYCQLLKVPYIFGGSSDDERKKWLEAFKKLPEMSCIGLSAVGDTALDIPEANVIIQVSSHFGARRQEAQVNWS